LKVNGKTEGNGVKRILRAILATTVISLVAAGTLLGVRPAAAASLTRVTGFGTNPTNLNMYLYTLNTVAAPTASCELRVYGGKCLDVPNSATANGTKLQIWSCNGGANQRWTRT
jgi:hypothetical protein